MDDKPSKFGYLFGDSINAFLNEKHLLGYDYKGQSSTLYDFSVFADKNGALFNNDAQLTKEGVEAWLISKRNDKPTTKLHRITVIRQFALHQNRAGYVSYIPPFCAGPKSTTDFVPYIFTERQIADILNAADCLPSTNVSPIRHLTMPLLFRLLYSCGLRVSEALNLKTSDIDFDNRIITVIGGKFGKDRNVPFSESLNLRLAEYAESVHSASNANETFFINAWRRPYAVPSINSVFQRLLEKCEIPRNDLGPRVHDLRHTFAVHCLKRWVNAGKDLNTLLPYLAAYMGHIGLESTQTYLRLTADLYPHILSTVQKHFGDVIPKAQRSSAL
jgi:integrase